MRIGPNFTIPPSHHLIRLWISKKPIGYIFSVLALAFSFTLAAHLIPTRASANKAATTRSKVNLARLSEKVSVRAAGQGAPYINFADGREVLTAYSGPDDLIQALETNQVEGRSLASADFDEDGVPDLISGYETASGGIVTVQRGNVDSIYPNAPEAKQRKAEGGFTDAPFLWPAYVVGVLEAVDFVGAGDFDGDSHWDVVAAPYGDKLYLLSSDGQGGLKQARQIELPGRVRALVVGEINRRDGLDDVVVGIRSEAGAKVLVYEGPKGDLRAKPEVFSVAEEVNIAGSRSVG